MFFTISYCFANALFPSQTDTSENYNCPPKKYPNYASIVSLPKIPKSFNPSLNRIFNFQISPTAISNNHTLAVGTVILSSNLEMQRKIIDFPPKLIPTNIITTNRIARMPIIMELSQFSLLYQVTAKINPPTGKLFYLSLGFYGSFIMLVFYS